MSTKLPSYIVLYEDPGEIAYLDIKEVILPIDNNANISVNISTISGLEHVPPSTMLGLLTTAKYAIDKAFEEYKV